MKNQNTFTLRSTNEVREAAHLELQLAVLEFQMTNKVTVCKPQKTPKSRKVTGKAKAVFGFKEPKNRPSTMWDGVEMV